MLILTLLSALAAVVSSPDEEAVLDVIDRFFVGYYAKDRGAVEATLAEGAVLGSARFNADGSIKAIGTPTDASSFLDYVENGSARIAEAYWDPIVQIRAGALAQVWAPYVVEADAELIHCGIDAVTLLKVDGEWLITDLHSTMEPGSCDELGLPGAEDRLRPIALIPHLSSVSDE